MTLSTLTRTLSLNVYNVIAREITIVCRYASSADWYAYFSVQSEVA